MEGSAAVQLYAEPYSYAIGEKEGTRTPLYAGEGFSQSYIYGVLTQSVGVSLVPKLDELWSGRMELLQDDQVTMTFETMGDIQGKTLTARVVEFPASHRYLQVAAHEIPSMFSMSGEDTKQFIEENDLQAGIAWLRSATRRFFAWSECEIALLPAEDNEPSVLGLKVHSALSSEQFRDHRHLILRAMLDAGYRSLYDTIGVFQRRLSSNGWQAISWYRKISSE